MKQPAQMQVKLETAEAMEVTAFINKCDAAVAGFQQGVEFAKRLFIQELIDRRNKQASQESQNG